MINENKVYLTLTDPKDAGHYNIRVLNDTQSDQFNDAVTFFNPDEYFIQKEKKAIIASGGDLEDSLSDITKKCSNWAYLALLAQGYTQNNIKYLSPYDFIDVDGDGQDDVNGKCVTSTLSSAIQDWGSDASELLVYLIDHGGEGTFQANQGEVIKASDLDSWFDTAQSSIPGKLIFIYDACYSGSFLPSMTTPPENERIVITSSLADEETWFEEDGVLSFGYQFWSSVSGNANLYESYKTARGMIENAQSPILDANGDARRQKRTNSWFLIF